MRAALVGFLVVASFASVAVAGPAEDTETAREQAKRGSVAYNLGHYAEAASAFEAAYRAVPDPALLFNLAQAYRLNGQPDKALTAYRSYLRTSPAGAKDREQAEKWKQEIERSAPALRDAPPVNNPPAAAPSMAPAVPAQPTANVSPAAPPPPPVAPPPRVLPPPPVQAPAPAPATADLTLKSSPPANAPPRQASRPIYVRWWFWAAVGIAAAGITTGVLLTRDHGNPDCLGINPCGSLH